MTGKMLKPDKSDGVLKTLNRELSTADLIAPDLIWKPFTGGRTNRIWRIGTGQGALVCKLFDPNGGTVLFPNDIAAESASLRALSSTGLAPELIAEFKSSYGPCLIYQFATGKPWRRDVRSVATTLRKLHQFPVPTRLRQVKNGATEIIRLGDKILNDCSLRRARQLHAARPNCPEITKSTNVFLHGDLVPGNIISSLKGNILIDWQCPATGDPCEDISTFLSPAMQTLYGHRPLGAEEQNDFLDAYGDRQIKSRFRALKPLFHWRMAAHCLWKFEKGNTDYLHAMELELAALEQC